MSLDISYQGLPLLRGASARFEDGGLFVPSEAPMPVATQLSLSQGEHQLAAKVRRVREGSGAGMVLVAQGGGKLPRWLMAVHPESAGAVSELFEAPPPPVVAPAAPPAAAASEAAAEAAPSTHTPDSEGDGAATAGDEDDDGKAAAKPGDGKKPAGGAAKKGGKKPRKR